MLYDYTGDVNLFSKQFVYCNPFLGKAVFRCPDEASMHLYGLVMTACMDKAAAAEGKLSICGTHGELDRGWAETLGPSNETLAQWSKFKLEGNHEVLHDLQHLGAVKRLLEYSADPNAITSEQDLSPLMLAAYYNNAAVTDMLLRAGADPELQR